MKNDTAGIGRFFNFHNPYHYYSPHVLSYPKLELQTFTSISFRVLVKYNIFEDSYLLINDLKVGLLSSISYPFYGFTVFPLRPLIVFNFSTKFDNFKLNFYVSIVYLWLSLNFTSIVCEHVSSL